MTQEEEKLLLKDICARLPYGVMLNINGYDRMLMPCDIDLISIDKIQCKPYLRPMSIMTEEEKEVVCSMNMISDTELNDRLNYQRMYVQNYTIETFDYFNERKLDYRGLIPMGLALEAHEGMY